MVYADREGAGPRYLQMRDTKHFPLPADAVQLVGPDQRRQVVLLRAEDCACPVGEDCPHGPEPVDALDLAVWLHAERSWQLDEMRLDLEKYRDYLKLANRTTERRGRERDAARAERAGLQARLDAVSKTCDAAEIAVKIGAAENPARWETAQAAITDVRAALQGDQPTEPADAGLKPRLLALRQEVLQDPALTRREVEDLKGAVLLLIMHLNHRAARQPTGEADRA